MDNDALRLRSEISRLSLVINQEITALNLAVLNLRDVATDTFALHIGDSRVSTAAGILQNRVVEDLKRSVGQLISIRQALEDYTSRT